MLRVTFLDDLTPNIAAARQFGWHCIQVRDAGAALIELSDHLHEDLVVDIPFHPSRTHQHSRTVQCRGRATCRPERWTRNRCNDICRLC